MILLNTDCYIINLYYLCKKIKFMDEETWIVVENGNIFEGTREQFMECFFSNADDEEISDWCFDNCYSLKIDDKIIFNYNNK